MSDNPDGRIPRDYDTGSDKTRERTDLGSLGVFVGTIACMIGLVLYSIHFGDIKRLTHPMDFEGRLCGVDTGVADKRFLFYCGTRSNPQSVFPDVINAWSRTCVSACPTNNSELIECIIHDQIQIQSINRTTHPNMPSALQDSVVRGMVVRMTQSTATIKSYPSEVYKGGQYCVPGIEGGIQNMTLRQSVLNGPLAEQSHIKMALGSIGRAWVVLLVVALLSVVLGLAYLFILKRFAGLLIFMSLVISTIFLYVLGFFFLWALFVQPDDQEGTYQKANPILRSFVGTDAKAYSCILGAALIGAGACLTFTTYYAIARIDESVGVIEAACSCIFSVAPCGLMLQPVVSAIVVFAVAGVLLFGLMLMQSVGAVDRTNITINGIGKEGLQARFQHDTYWWIAIAFYCLGSFWILEVVLSISSFCVAFSVCKWYFVPIIKAGGPPPLPNSLKNFARIDEHKKVVEVRVAGVDGVGTERAGIIATTDTGKVLITAVGKRGPGGRDVITTTAKCEDKKMPTGTLWLGLYTAIFYHLGSFAHGAVLICLTRPVRTFAQGIRGLQGQGQSKRATFDDEQYSTGGMISVGVGLIASFLDAYFGGYSMNAFTDIVLSASDFHSASKNAYEFIINAGGAVAFLHGSCALYEAMGVVLISLICATLTFTLLTEVDYWCNPSNVHTYVSDPWMMTVLGAAISSIISYGFMGLFNNVSDTMLYVFAWHRKWCDSTKEFEKYCPATLWNLLGDNEMGDEPASALRARGNKMSHFKHAFSRFGNTAVDTMRQMGTQYEQHPLLGGPIDDSPGVMGTMRY